MHGLSSGVLSERGWRDKPGGGSQGLDVGGSGLIPASDRGPGLAPWRRTELMIKCEWCIGPGRMRMQLAGPVGLDSRRAAKFTLVRKTRAKSVAADRFRRVPNG
jgi:hypothetical protein